MRVAGVGLLLASALSLMGCTGTATPTPTTSHTLSFASEHEALAAAKATYQGYLDAYNKVDVTDTQTFEPVYTWLTAKALTTSRDSLDETHDERFVKSGDTVLHEITLVTDTLPRGTLTADLCLDLSAVDLTDSGRRSVVDATASTHQSIRLGFAPSDTPTGMRITSTDWSKADACG